MGTTPSITCPRCGKTSYNRHDISERYCGHCHLFHEHMAGVKPIAYINSQADLARSCPVCQRVLDGTTSVTLNGDDPRPRMEPGDVTCCAYCGTILTATATGFQPATEADLLAVDPVLRRLLFEFSAEHHRESRS